MKRILSPFLWALFTLVAFTGCKDDEVNPRTSLEITVLDEAGNRVEGATVKLYTSQIDLENKTNQFGATQTTDATGKATFKDLQTVQYFWAVEKGCQNNGNNSVTTPGPLEANKNTVVTTNIEETGTLILSNTSSDPYNIFINNVAAGTAEGKTNYTIKDFPTGQYVLKVVQKSGFVISPTTKEYQINIGCGATQTIVFP